MIIFLLSIIFFVLYLFVFTFFLFFCLYQLCFTFFELSSLNFFYVLFSVSFITVSYIIKSDLFYSYKIFWIKTIFLTNLFGCVLYYFCGKKDITFSKKIFKKKIFKLLTSFQNNINPNEIKNNHVVSNYIFNQTGSQLFEASEINYFFKCEEIKQAVLDEVKKAEKFIFIEFFIISKCHFFNSLLEILIEKAKQNVDVRLIYDSWGSFNNFSNLNYDKKLNKLGIKTLVFNRLKLFKFFNFYHCDHKKKIIIDGKTCLLSSFNVIDDFNDCMIKLQNTQAIHSATAFFLAQWFELSNINLSIFNIKNENYKKFFPIVSKLNNNVKKENIDNNNFAQLSCDFSYDYANLNFNVLLQLISNAKKSIYIINPYFFINDILKNELILALKRGVKLVIITPFRSDVYFFRNISVENFNEFLKYGAKIYLHINKKKVFLHAKTFVIDDKFVLTGSFNLNFRSFFFDCESDIFTTNTNCIQDIKKHFSILISESQIYHTKKIFFIFKYFLRKIKIFF